MDALISLFFQIFVLVPIGFICGRFSERKHNESLLARQAENADVLVSDLKNFPMVSPDSKTPEMLIGEVTIATDYYKSFAGSLRNFFGGEMISFETLQIRARNEATMKIIEQAKEKGFNAICNLRLETADVGGSSMNKKYAITVSILASATAYNSNH